GRAHGEYASRRGRAEGGRGGGRRRGPRRRPHPPAERRASTSRSPRAVAIGPATIERQRERVRSTLTLRAPREPSGNRIPVGPVYVTEARLERPFLLEHRIMDRCPQEEDDDHRGHRAEPDGEANERRGS